MFCIWARDITIKNRIWNTSVSDCWECWFLNRFLCAYLCRHSNGFAFASDTPLPTTLKAALSPSQQCRVITEATPPFRVRGNIPWWEIQMLGCQISNFGPLEVPVPLGYEFTDLICVKSCAELSQVVHVNTAWEHLCGYSADEVVGKDLRVIQAWARITRNDLLHGHFLKFDLCKPFTSDPQVQFSCSHIRCYLWISLSICHFNLRGENSFDVLSTALMCRRMRKAVYLDVQSLLKGCGTCMVRTGSLNKHRRSEWSRPCGTRQTAYSGTSPNNMRIATALVCFFKFFPENFPQWNFTFSPEGWFMMLHCALQMVDPDV